MAVFAVSTVNRSDQVVLPRRVPLSHFLKDGESAFRSRLRNGPALAGTQFLHTITRSNYLQILFCLFHLFNSR
jgi:hypothetical protein